MPTLLRDLKTSPLRQFPRMARALCLSLSCLVVACGGGGGGGGSDGGGMPLPPVVTPPTTTAPDLPSSGTAISFASAADDPVGKGKSLVYTQAIARIELERSGDLLKLRVHGDERWTMNLRVGGALPAALKTGEYKDLPAVGSSEGAAFTWDPEVPGGNCSGRLTTLTVERVVFDGDAVSELALSFDQRCASTVGPMRGRVRWLAADTSRGPGPVQPLPGGLWSPPAGSTPASGNFIYLESAAGDAIGGGRTYLHTQGDSAITATLAGPSMSFTVRGDTTWFGRFLAMDSQTRVQPGYYGDLKSYQRLNPRKGGFHWVQQLQTCDFQTRGWVAVDAVQYRGDVLSLVELRFEQRCQDGVAAPLRGKIRWSIDDPTQPAGPQFPPPAGLWQPTATNLPSSGNYVFLEGEAGEWISQGQKLLITPDQTPLLVFDASGQLQVTIGGLTEEWRGSFKGPYNRQKLERGYYAGLLAPVTGNLAKGGLRWTGQGRGCEPTGWFSVDDVAYTHGELRRIDLRFEQVCAGSGKRMNGRIRWASSDPVVLENRVDDATQGFAPPAAVDPLTPPANGSYVLLDSGADDYVGGGGSGLYSAANATIGVTADSNVLQVKVDGNERWLGRFARGQPARPLVPGTYPVAATLTPDDGATMNWGGEGRGCNLRSGSFTIDKLLNSANGVLELDLRFEQYCDDSYTPLRGVVHWVANDPGQPAGPVWPAPADLWRLPASQVPATGNYLFVHSAPGSFVGEGKNHVLTPSDSEFIVTPSDGGLSLRVVGTESWFLELRPMRPLTRLQPGYYGNLQRVVSMNPARGGVDLSGNSRGCNGLAGWFVVDAVSYEGSQVSSLDLRLAQQCDSEGPPLFAQLRWRR